MQVEQSLADLIVWKCDETKTETVGALFQIQSNRAIRFKRDELWTQFLISFSVLTQRIKFHRFLAVSEQAIRIQLHQRTCMVHDMISPCKQGFRNGSCNNPSSYSQTRPIAKPERWNAKQAMSTAARVNDGSAAVRRARRGSGKLDVLAISGSTPRHMQTTSVSKSFVWNHDLPGFGAVMNLLYSCMYVILLLHYLLFHRFGHGLMAVDAMHTHGSASDAALVHSKWHFYYKYFVICFLYVKTSNSCYLTVRIVRAALIVHLQDVLTVL